MSKKKIVFNAYDLLNSPEMSAYLDQVEAEESERQKRRDAEMAARQRQSGSKPGHSVSDDELSADALKRDNIRQATDDISGRANDVWQALKSGSAQLIQGAGWLANKAGAHDSGQFLRDIGQIGEDQALANMTPAGREAQKNGVFKEDLSGVNNDWGRGMAQGIAGSAVPSIVGALLGAPVARGIGAAGDALLGRAAVSEGALGSVLDAAIKYTPAPVMRLAGALPGAAGAGAGEAAVTGATNGAQAYQEVMDAPIESLRKSPAFQSLSKELGSEDAARKAIADRMSIQTAKDTALSTGLIGAAMGGGAVGSLLNKFAVKQGAKEVGRLGAKAAAKEVLKDGAKEFAEEFAQSGPEHYLQNAAKRDYLDPTIDPSTGMLRASLEGGVVGMGQGMGMSGGAHAVNRLLARNEPQPGQPANTPQQQPNTQPSSTPKSAAGYDPIAPNQQALLQRLGVEPDPAADEAAASVESIFGAGDPTAGLVASVMRGDAMQPVHDMAAVRANTVLPVGSNEGGLYEPQWLPDAASGESSNGMRMPRRGFDSQEQLLANAGMDAQDMQRQADIASQIDAAWAQQQNPVQKARELESLAQESAVPVAIDRAEQSNQINQALANAAGEGVAVPNAMQLALQRAKAGGEAKLDGVVDVTPPASVESKAPNISKEAPNTSDQAPNISSEPALTMQQNERGQWMIKGDMAQHAQTIRDALPGTKLVVSQKSGHALVQMPADKNTGKQGKAIRKALDHLLLSGEQLAARDQQRANASERAKAANKQAQQIDPERDDIVNAVAKLGGIDTEQALSEWWRGQRETIGHYNAEVPGNLRRQGVFAFKRGGMAIDDMVRHLEGEGYLPHNATPNDLLDALENRSKHPAGYEADARAEFEAQAADPQQDETPSREFQQAYDEGGFADEFTKRELEEETDYFELNRQNREAAEDAAATAKAAELDALIDNAPVIPSRPGPVTEEELDAIFGQQSRNAAAEGTQTDREPAAGRSMEGAESGAATAEAAPEEDGFDLAGYTESDLRRQGREAEQQQREVERQRAAADKARQDEETRKEIRRRSEAAADTFTLGGNAEDNLTGQGGLFDAPAETIHKPISKSDGSGFATRDALRAAATRDGIPQSSLIEKRDEAGNWIGIRHEPDNVIDRIITDQSRAGKVIGTSIRDLHSDDVYTLLMAASSKKQINAIADYIGKYAPRAAADAVKSHLDSALKQKGWATEEALYGGGMFDAPTESSSAPTATDEMAALKAEMGDAIGELASILGARKNLTPDEESKIIPVMSKIFRIAAKMGYVKFKDAARHVMSQIRELAGNEIADKLSIDNLQAGYINIASEIGGDKREALAYDSIEELEKEHVTDQHSRADLERDSENAAPENRVGAQSVRHGRAGNGRTGRSGVEGAQAADQQRDSISPSGHEAVDTGARSDSAIYTGSPRVEADSAGSRVDFGSADAGLPGLPVEPPAAEQIAKLARTDHRGKPQEQIISTSAIVDDALPLLTEGQRQDVVKAEARFSVPDGYGMLFTNGTGTGKTFTGLGTIKRFVNRGKTNILVVAPNDKIIEDWQRSGKLLGLELARLESTTDAGSGLVITTYANMGANNALAGREWDLIVHDEAHYLAMDKDGTNTNALKALRAISLHPDGVYTRHQMLNGAEIEKANQLAVDAKMQRNSDNEQLWYLANETQAKADKLTRELSDKLDAIKADVAARQGEARTRVLFLSATPFAYEKTIDWANGYLFDYNEGRGDEGNSYRGYNEGSNRDQFFVQHFGYRMRYGKLTEPEAKVDRGLMQRQFNAYLKKRGALSGRMLDVKADYDRRFILVDSAIGQRIDAALYWLDEQSRKVKDDYNPYRRLSDEFYDNFDYLSKRYTLEAIKAQEVLPHVREHLAMGRKVVVFHDYKKGGGINPFLFKKISETQTPPTSMTPDEWEEARINHSRFNAAVDKFNAEFSDMVNSDLFNASSPINIFQKEFPGVLLFNGDIPPKQRRANVAKFQDDDSGPQVILVQSAAGKEGISLHDTTGKHQRVLFNLGQPTQPTTAIQQEGRIYRTGQVTDAIFRYLSTGTTWEKWTFATTVATRSSAAENLGMGEMARALKDAFIAAFEESGDYRAGMDGEGKGGKERDRAANEALTEYDRARAFYFGTQKKTAQTKAMEGKDYFATPEPVGLKMAQFADVRPGESVLEPSAGHGAIARWFPDNANRTAIEPSMTLRSRLAMVFDGDIVGSDFEDYNIVNKYDAIVMNPPFGLGGKTAVDHLAKAAGHLRDGGRIVALLPSGPAADKRLDKFLYEDAERPVKPLLDHPTLGPVYRGDTIKTNASWAPEGKLLRKDRGGSYWLEIALPDGRKQDTAVNPASWMEAKPTGPRKESYRPAGDLSLVADIKLPAVTFERAGTGVMTHIVVLEKAKDGANIQQINRDLTGIDDIHELFNRMENMELPKRTNAAEARTPDRAPVSNQAEKAADDTAPASSAASADIVEHVTGKGKTLRGVIRTDMTLAQAKAIDPYTFKKDGGYFIRERYLSDGKMERREPSLNGGAIDSNEPKADYTDYYETDLFGNPLPDAGRKTRATKTAQPEVRRNVLAASTVQGDTPAPDGDYKVRTIVGSESQRKLGARSITSVADLAVATSYLYRSAVERFDAIVTDASGKPLAVIGAFKGAIDQASVYPATLVGEAVRIPGAAQIWFSHNHPSGTAKLSDADRSLYHRLADVFDGSGITPMGLIAVANRQYASMEDSYLPIPQSSESMSVPVIERELSATDIDMPAITSPQSAKDLASSLYKGSDYQPGMMLLNTQNQLAAWVPLPATAMGALRHSGGLNAIYRAISESNAGAVILVHGGELSERIGSVTLGQNIAAAVAKLDVRPLDIIDIRKPRSAAETGELIQSGPVYSKANDYTSTQGMSAKELQAIIAKALPAHLRERVKVEQSRSNNTQQSAQSEDNDLIEAEYDLSTQQITLYADAIPTPERALFVLSHELTHYGLDAKYGFGLSSILLEARNNPMIAKLAAAIAVDRGMTVNSVRQDIADALGVPVARVASSAGVYRLQVETANEALAELNAAIERNDFAYLQDRYGVAVPKMMRNDLRGRLSRLAASVKAWLAKLTGKQASDYSDKQVWDLLAGVRETVRSNVATEGSGDGESLNSKAGSGVAFIDVDGVKRPTTNSNGQPIHPTEGGVRNFWRWFGGSKVVDKDGKPLVVYHGTAYDFSSFDAGRHRTELNNRYQGDGFHFSADPAVASRYADANRNRLLRKDDIYPLVAQRFPGRIFKLFKDTVEHGYSKAWDIPQDEVSATIMEGDKAGIDLNDLLDLAEVVEGSRYHAGRNNGADPSEIFSAMFGGNTGDLLSAYHTDAMVRLGLDAAAPAQNVIPAYLKSDKPLLTDSQKEAAAARNNGYDGVYYSGPDIVDGVHEWVVFSSEQIKSAVGNSGAFDPANASILKSTKSRQQGRFQIDEETTAQQAQREVQDNMNRWKQVLENVREQGGQVDEQNDVYGAEERFHGRTATRIEDFARDEVEPLMQRLAESGRSLQEVEQFLLAQHAEEANARIREIDDSRDTAFGMEDGEAQSILAKFAAMPDAAEFKRLANDFRRISEGTLSLYVKAGIVAPDSAHAMRLAYQFYVPVKGGDEDQAARQGTGKGLSVNGKQKRRMGHDMRDEHVLENMLRDRQRAIVLAEKNNVGTYLLDLIERNPDPKLWTVGVLPKQKVLRDQVSYVVELNGQMLDAFNSLEAARVFIQAEAARTGSKPGAFAVSKSSDPYVTMMAKPTLQDNEVQVYVQGRAVRIQLHDPIMAGQYRRMGTEQMGRLIEAGKSLNRWLSKVYTGYNPEFFVRNVVRDLFAGTINLTADRGGKVAAKALSHWPKAGAAMFRFALTGKAPAGEYGKALQRYRAAGGSTGAAYMGDLERQADTLQTLYENYTGAMAAMQEGKPVKAAKIATRKLLGGLAHWFEVWNQAGENAFRLATFMAMEESGKSVAQSASMAKNVTVNFNRKGELTPQLGGLYLFFNPGVQGTARLWQSLAGKDTKHKKQAWALVGSMAGAALAIAMMNRGDDEDEWEAIPDSVKDRNLIIPLGNKRKLTIPLPYGYSFFVSLANRLDAVMHGESAEKASIRLASAVFENFSPVGNPVGDDPKLANWIMLLPTALKIPALPAANMTDFGGPMRPEYREDQPDNEKMWRGTRGSLYDKAAQGLSSLAGSPYEDNFWNDVSPETIKYLVRTLTGGTGSFMADSASLLNVLASGSAPDVSEVPFVRSGMRESTVKDARARFHELGNEAKEHVAAWKRAVDAGDDKAATEYEQDGELMAMGEMLEGYRKQAKSLRDLMALEMQREDLTLAEKRMKQKAYENQEAEVYREFIRQFKH